jgi:hypothetical protein
MKWDNNTDFFHIVANGKKRKHTIFSFQNGDKIILGTEQLLLHATTFYKDLFGPDRGNAFHLDPGLWPDVDKLTRQENSELTKPFLGRWNKASFVPHGEK